MSWFVSLWISLSLFVLCQATLYETIQQHHVARPGHNAIQILGELKKIYLVFSGCLLKTPQLKVSCSLLLPRTYWLGWRWSWFLNSWNFALGWNRADLWGFRWTWMDLDCMSNSPPALLERRALEVLPELWVWLFHLSRVFQVQNRTPPLSSPPLPSPLLSSPRQLRFLCVSSLSLEVSAGVGRAERKQRHFGFSSLHGEADSRLKIYISLWETRGVLWSPWLRWKWQLCCSCSAEIFHN